MPSISSGRSFERGIIPKAVSLYDVASFGLVEDFFIYHLSREETIFRVIGSPSSLVVRKIISGIKARKNPNTFRLFLIVRYLKYDFTSLFLFILLMVLVYNRMEFKAN